MYISKLARRGIAMLLALTLVMSFALPTFAVDSNTVSLQLNDDSLDVSATDQTVTLDIVTSEAVSVDSLMYTIEVPTGWSVAQPTMPNGITDVRWVNNQLIWYSTTTDVAGLTNLGSAVITVPANTAAGEYEIKVSGFDASAELAFWVEQATYTTTLTITEPAANGYTAGLNTTTPTVTVGGTATVNVGVSHSSDSAFNAAEIVIGYDSTKLSVGSVTNSITDDHDLQYTDANGVLTIQDFGADKSFSTSNYVITFTTKGVTAANTPATATVTLTSAKFIDKDGATTSDLIAATLSTASVDVTITEETFDVTLPTDGVITGDTEAVKGADYTFTVAEPDNYEYDITVTVGGNEIATVVDNGDGTYTIPGTSVTGNIVITYERTANTYGVTWEGAGAADVTTKPAQATYGTPFTFTLPADIEAGLEPGWEYAATVTIGGNTYGCSVDGLNYTIAGADITGAIVITVTKTEVDENQYTVSATGTGAGDAATSSPVNKNGTATLTLTPEAGYDYEVTATMVGQTTVSVTQQGNVYTVADVTGNVVFTVTKTLITDGVVVQEYVTLDGAKMWLVTFNPTLAEGKVPTYDGNVMFYSEKYQAYCYLVIANALTEENAKPELGVAIATATKVDYGMNINGSAHIDAADAQLVWNMYSAQYTGFTSGVTMAQFLAADQNAVSTDTDSFGLSVQDALVIIDAILAGSAQ